MGHILSKEELGNIWDSGKFTQDEFDQLVINSRPSLWAETYLCSPDNEERGKPLELQWYQKKAMDDPNPLKSMRIGRGGGKSCMIVSYCFWHCMTEANCQIFYYIPTKSQLERIYTVMELEISESIVRDSIVEGSFSKEALGKKDALEHVINFKNGSRIVFFLCHQNIDRIRSHHGAAAIILDEAAILKQEAIDAIMGIITNSRGIIWAASTPTGRETWFYNWDNSPNVTAIHAASSQSRYWNATKETAAKQAYPALAMYNREIMAIWDDEETTVYPTKFVDEAIFRSSREYGAYHKLDYKDPDFKRFLDPEQLYQEYIDQRKYLTIGVDWNDPTAGVRIVQAIQTENEVVIAKIDKISDPKFTQTKAAQHVISLYNTLKPDLIYVDLGHSTAAVEHIHYYIEQSRNMKFKEVFNVIDFSAPIEISREIAPYIRNTANEKERIVKVRTKNFIVSVMHEHLKAGTIILPAFEDIKDGLCHELRAFKLDKIGANGEPVYSKYGGQHSHFAAGLAVLALYDIGKAGRVPKDLPDTILGMTRSPYGRNDKRLPPRVEAIRTSPNEIYGSSSFRNPYTKAGRLSNRRNALI